MTTNNIYDCLSPKYCKISYWAKKLIPIFYISYFFMGRCYVSIENLGYKEFSLFWKYFAENDYVKKLADKYEIIKGKNVIVTGYPKIDHFAKIQKEPRDKKRIIIAPHHSIDNREVAVGGFLYYADIILKIIEKYPQIDFFFRPHQILFTELLKDEYWGKEKTKKYLDKLSSYPNVTYHTEGNYASLFVNSDALIHDCGSFTCEYMCTGHPCAYILMRPTFKMEKALTPFGQEVIYKHYMINSENDFYSFIDNVVLNENDYRYEERMNFAKKNILINYPHITDVIFENLISSFKEGS